MMLRHAGYSVLLVLGAGCRAPADSPAGLNVTIDSSGRYPIVRSLGEAPRWTARQLFQLGSSGSGPTEFGSIRSVLLDGQGTLYVVDPSHRALSQFDSTGRFVRQIGREGPGPGEYKNPYSVAWLDGGLALLDPGNVRLGLYDSAGQWKTSWPTLPISGGQMIRLYRTPPTFWTYGHRVTSTGREGVFIRYGATGPQDTMLYLRPATGTAPGRACPVPRGITFFSPPFGASLLEVPAPDGARVLALTSAYRIAFIGATGDTLRVIERLTTPAPISDAEWEEGNADWRKFQKEGPTASCDRGEFDRPASKPPLAWLFYDDVGRLWVEVVTPEGPRYDIFQPDGRLVATVARLPSAEGVDPSVAGDRIALVGRDSTDVPVVRVFRFSPEP